MSPALRQPLRMICFIAILFNAVTVALHLRTQELKLQYSLSRLQAQIERETDSRRDLSQRLLEEMQKEKLARVRDAQ